MPKLACFFCGEQKYWEEKEGQEFMRIYGDFTNHEYQMEAAGQAVAAVHRKWVSLRDQMGVSITGNVDHRVVIATVIVIEHVEVSQSHSSGGAFNSNIRF
jgi:uncharacterized protein YxjI